MLTENLLANIPKVDRILSDPQIVPLVQQYSRRLVVHIIRNELQALRDALQNPENTDEVNKAALDYPRIIKRLKEVVSQQLRPRVLHCVNASGVVLHTGLGRSPLSDAARQALVDAASGFARVEFILESGERGDRHTLVEDLLIELTGAESAAVVNNNAAATMLVLNTLSEQTETIVSRGELVTIGGSFRIPDIMQRSGAIMVDVGTTNKTNRRDFERAISEETSLLAKIHTSNYRIVGFHDEVSLEEMVELGRQYRIPVLHDLGSGSLVNLERYGLPAEPVVRDSIEAGADIVTFSGDKLLGGPQAGIIVGKKAYVDLIKSNQLARALRCGKLTFAALEATLRLFFDEEKLLENHRIMRMMTQSVATIRKRAQKLRRQLLPIIAEHGDVKIESASAEVGGGSMAAIPFETVVVSIALKHISEKMFARDLRMGDPPIIPRIQKGVVWLDMFTVDDTEIGAIVQVIKSIVEELDDK